MRKTIAIVAGGDSGEFEISIKSAAVVGEHLDTQQYVTYIIIVKGNEYTYTDDIGKKYIIDQDDFSLKINGEKIKFDVVFNAIHGTPGEDGILQKYLDMIGIPYTSCGHETSALTFNKYLCNQKVAEAGVKVATSVLFQKDIAADYDEALRICSLPCFVKPNNGGSSVGMSKVNDASSLPEAIQKAFKEDEQVLVEGFIPGREITCGVIIRNEKIHALPLTEVISENEFFDYEAKYTDGLAREITPADIPIGVEQDCKATSKKLYSVLNCKGFVRFDYIFNERGMYFLEVNTVPGLSPNSIVPQQARADGISLSELFSEAIEQAINP